MDELKPDIFKSRIELSEFAGAGIVTIKSPCGVNTNYKVNSGSPFQPAYNEAFSLAISSQLPLWFEGKCLYSPNYKDDINNSGD